MTSEGGKSQWVVKFIYGRVKPRSEIERKAGGARFVSRRLFEVWCGFGPSWLQLLGRWQSPTG